MQINLPFFYLTSGYSFVDYNLVSENALERTHERMHQFLE